MSTRNILGIEVNALLPSVASHLAHMGDTEQAEFFQTFAFEMIKACGTHYMAEKQAFFINAKLAPSAREIFATIGMKRDA